MKTRSRMMKKCRNLKNEIKTRWGTFFAAAFSFVNRLQKKEKEKIASSIANLQAAGKTCPKTSWVVKKPASSPLGPSKDDEMTAEVGLQPSHNLAWTKTKMGFVGSGCEKAKHHLNPSPKRPKTRGNRRKDMSQNMLGRQKTKTKMGLVGSGCEKDKHHLNPSPKRPKTRGNRRKDMSQNKLGRQKNSALSFGAL